MTTSRCPALLVGTFHMDNPALDFASVVADDVLAPERQAQIGEVAAGLSTFRPTKVAVEARWGRPTVAARYREYRAGETPLRRSEVEQLGFRVAASLGHETVYPVDVSDQFFDPEVERLAAANPTHRRLFEGVKQAAKQMVAEQQRWLEEGTIGQTLRRMNHPKALHEALALTTRLVAPIADAPAYPGPDMVASWYRRNLRIFAHLYEITEPGDRLLVLYGQGHIPVLRHFMELSDRYDVVDPLPWLPLRPDSPGRSALRPLES